MVATINSTLNDFVCISFSFCPFGHLVVPIPIDPKHVSQYHNKDYEYECYKPFPTHGHSPPVNLARSSIAPTQTNSDRITSLALLSDKIYPTPRIMTAADPRNQYDQYPLTIDVKTSISHSFHCVKRYTTVPAALMIVWIVTTITKISTNAAFIRFLFNFSPLSQFSPATLETNLKIDNGK